jgi:hypothetical protein
MLTWGERIALIVMVILITVVSAGATCNTSSTLDTIRQVHMAVREAGMRADAEIAPRFERQGDICTERAAAAGFSAGSGEEGFAYWRECMEQWYQLRTAVNSFRTSLEELENVYQDIEDRGEADWQHWAGRVVDHGRTLLRLIREVGPDIATDILSTLQEQLDALCRIIQCEEGAES